jgi:hypothetical protein
MSFLRNNEKNEEENSTGNVKSLVNSSTSHLRRFRLFLVSDETAEPSVLKGKKIVRRTLSRMKQNSKVILKKLKV